MVKAVVGQSPKPMQSFPVDPAASREIDEWFYPTDGQACIRVAQAILQLLAKRKQTRDQSVVTPLGGASPSHTVKSYLEFAGGMALGTRRYGFIRNVARILIVNRRLV